MFHTKINEYIPPGSVLSMTKDCVNFNCKILAKIVDINGVNINRHYDKNGNYVMPDMENLEVNLWCATCGKKYVVNLKDNSILAKT